MKNKEFAEIFYSFSVRILLFLCITKTTPRITVFTALFGADRSRQLPI